MLLILLFASIVLGLAFSGSSAPVFGEPQIKHFLEFYQLSEPPSGVDPFSDRVSFMKKYHACAKFGKLLTKEKVNEEYEEYESYWIPDTAIVHLNDGAPAKEEPVYIEIPGYLKCVSYKKDKKPFVSYLMLTGFLTEEQVKEDGREKGHNEVYTYLEKVSMDKNGTLQFKARPRG